MASQLGLQAQDIETSRQTARLGGFQRGVRAFKVSHLHPGARQAQGDLRRGRVSGLHLDRAGQGFGANLKVFQLARQIAKTPPDIKPVGGQFTGPACGRQRSRQIAGGFQQH